MNENNFAISVNNLVKKFGSFVAVDTISFSVKKGEIFGFLGPNGAGKSTTIKILCGILKPSLGSGHVGGYDIIKEQFYIRQNIGYMSQKFSLYPDLTVEENIDFFAGIYSVAKNKKRERKNWVLEMAGLTNLRDKLTGSLAGGWKQRLALGCSIIHQPQIIFLDEPTSGVDPISRQNFWKLIKTLAAAGITIFVTTHYMDEAQNCERIAFIYKGKIIAADTPDNLRKFTLKKDVLAVTLPEPEKWLEKIQKLASVQDAGLFGTIIHLIVNPGEQIIADIQEFLQRQNAGKFYLEKMVPSLEDVFIWLITEVDKHS
jgi:ABC-2 type transport system ATP-binding protein